METNTMTNGEMAFSTCIDIPVARSSKPRTIGLNFSGDWGLSLGQVEDILESRGEYLDHVKLAVLSGRLYTRDYIKKKVALYNRHQVEVFPGGMTLEAAVVNRKVEEFFDETQALGCTVIEVSESEVHMTPATKLKLVEMGVARGLKVQVELGPHHADKPFAVNHTIKECKDYLSAGAFKICLEGAVTGGVMKPWENQQSADKLHTIIDSVGVDNLIFEVWGPFPHCIQWFVLNYGPDVSFGNVQFDRIIQIEHIRRGLNYPETWFGKFAAL